VNARKAAPRAPSEVHLIGGQWRRSRLPVADRPGLRPTPARVRETLYNWLGQDLAGWQVLDAFGGSGALGFEAASRGAARVLIVERDPVLAATLRAVRARLRAEAVVDIVCADGVTLLQEQAAASLDLVLLDPPFSSSATLMPAALKAAAGVLRPGGFVHAEAPQPLTAWPEGLVVHRQARAGQVHHHLLRRSEGGEAGYTAPAPRGEVPLEMTDEDRR
jgi:16S rRNA (guanine(966)-N(2))-methyltransferase RsmD